MGMAQAESLPSSAKAGAIVRLFAQVGAILCIVSYMRASGEVSWKPLVALSPPFHLTGVKKRLHFLTLLVVVGIQLWYWHTQAQHVPGAPLYICGTLLTVIASGPI